MADTFISYSRKDIAFAKIIHELLQNSQLETWIDWQDIPPSADWFEEIKEAIEQADTFVFIISPTSVQSEICSKEIAHAERNNKRLIPIVIGDIDNQLVPSTLQPLNWIFFKEEDKKYAKALADLVAGITLDQPWLKAHTRIQNRALEWERSQNESGYLLHGADLEEAESWLSQALGKDPAPTTLQTQYILASRTQATRRQRRTLFGVAFGLVVAVVLGILAWTQRNVAVSESQMRATAQVEAENAEATAVEEAFSRATQQAIAEEQRIIAELKGLAALSLSKQNQTQFNVALLLAIEGLRKQVNNDTKSAMLDALTYNLKLVRYLQVDEVSNIFVVAANSDMSQIAAVAGWESKVYLLDPVTGLLEYPPIDMEEMIISELVFSPDDSILVCAVYSQTGKEAGKVFLIDAMTGKPLGYSLLRPVDRQNKIEHLRFIDDTTLIGISGSIFRSALDFWDINSGEMIERIDLTVTSPGPMTISSDRTLIAVAGSDDRLQIVDVQTKDLLVDQEMGLGEIISMSFSPDDKILALGNTRGEVMLWDVAAQEKISPPLTHDSYENVNHVLFVGDSTLISADDEYIKFWNYSTGELLAKWNYDSYTFPRNNMEVSSDEQLLIAGESNGRISLYTIWETPAGKIPFQYEDYSIIDILKISVSGDYVYTIIKKYNEHWSRVGSDEIVIWDLSTGEPTPERINLRFDILDYAEMNFDETILAYSGHNTGDERDLSNLEFFDLSNGKELDQSFHFDDFASIADFYFFPTGTTLAAISNNNQLLVYDYLNANVVSGPVILGDLEHLLSGEILEGYAGIIVDPDGKWIFVWGGDEDFVIRMYDANTLEPVEYSFAGHLDGIVSMDISSDGAYLVSLGYDNQLILWDVHTGGIISKIPYLSSWDFGGIDGVRFSPDGSMIAVAYDDMLQILDVPSLVQIGPPLSGNIRHLNVAFPDTDLLLSYGGYFVTTDPGHFSPDGTKLLVGGREYLRMISLDINAWIERACFRAGRNLTPEEWATYLPFDDYRKTCPQYP